MPDSAVTRATRPPPPATTGLDALRTDLQCWRRVEKLDPRGIPRSVSPIIPTQFPLETPSQVR